MSTAVEKRSTHNALGKHTLRLSHLQLPSQKGGALPSSFMWIDWVATATWQQIVVFYPLYGDTVLPGAERSLFLLTRPKILYRLGLPAINFLISSFGRTEPSRSCSHYSRYYEGMTSAMAYKLFDPLVHNWTNGVHYCCVDDTVLVRVRPYLQLVSFPSEYP